MLCRYPGTTKTRALPMSIHDALRQYLKRHGAIAPHVEGRVSAEGANGTVLSEYELHKGAN